WVDNRKKISREIYEDRIRSQEASRCFTTNHKFHVGRSMNTGNYDQRFLYPGFRLNLAFFSSCFFCNAAALLSIFFIAAVELLFSPRRKYTCAPIYGANFFWPDHRRTREADITAACGSSIDEPEQSGERRLVHRILPKCMILSS
ncbi:hypothetical protein MIMGU_mgv1a023967mg, partial [Erythranthe guttata]